MVHKFEDPWVETLTMTVMFLLSTLHLALGPCAQLRRMWKDPRWALWLKGLIDASTQVSDPDAHASHVKMHFYRRRCAVYQAAAQAVMLLDGVSLIWATAFMFKTTVVLDDDDNMKGRTAATVFTNDPPFNAAVMYGLYHTGSYLALAAICASLSFGKFSVTVERARHEVVYAIVMCLLCGFALFYPCAWWDSELALVRLAVSLVHRSTGPSFVWNALYFICRKYKLSIMAVVSPTLKAESCVRDPWTETFEFLAIVGLSWLVESLAWEEANATIQARSTANERKALSSILNATCDAVVNLDAHFKVVGPNPKLAAMLLRSNASVDGISFGSLFPDGEGVSFMQNLAQTKEAAREGVCAKIFRANMRDAEGNTIPIHAYDTLFTDLDVGECHLIGISEIGEEREQQQQQQLFSYPARRPSHRPGSRDRSPAGHQGDYQGMSRTRSGQRADRPEWAAEVAELAAATGRAAPAADAAGGMVRMTNPELGPELMSDNPEDLALRLYVGAPSIGSAHAARKQTRARRRSRRAATPTRGTPSEAGSSSSGSVGTLSEARSSCSGSVGGSVGSFSLEAVAAAAAAAPDRAGMTDFLHPNLAPTSLLAEELSLVRVLLQWNFQAGGACCTYHAGLRLLLAVTKTMKRQACMQLNPSDVEGPQCKSCGILSCQPARAHRCCKFCEQIWELSHAEL